MDLAYIIWHVSFVHMDRIRKYHLEKCPVVLCIIGQHIPFNHNIWIWKREFVTSHLLKIVIFGIDCPEKRPVVWYAIRRNIPFAHNSWIWNRNFIISI